MLKKSQGNQCLSPVWKFTCSRGLHSSVPASNCSSRIKWYQDFDWLFVTYTGFKLYEHIRSLVIDPFRVKIPPNYKEKLTKASGTGKVGQRGKPSPPNVYKITPSMRSILTRKVWGILIPFKIMFGAFKDNACSSVTTVFLLKSSSTVFSHFLPNPLTKL